MTRNKSPFVLLVLALSAAPAAAQDGAVAGRVTDETGAVQGDIEQIEVVRGAGVGDLGRQRDDRRRQHHHQAAARLG